MVQGSQDFRLASEAFHPLLVLRESFRQNFDRDVTLELRIASAINLALYASTDEREDLVGAETCAGR